MTLVTIKNTENIRWELFQKNEEKRKKRSILHEDGKRQTRRQISGLEGPETGRGREEGRRMREVFIPEESGKWFTCGRMDGLKKARVRNLEGVAVWERSQEGT